MLSGDFSSHSMLQKEFGVLVPRSLKTLVNTTCYLRYQKEGQVKYIPESEYLKFGLTE